MIYDKTTKQAVVKNIADAYSIINFNSPETEKLLATKYESKIAPLFQRIFEAAAKNQNSVIFSNSEYKLLFRFFVIMWRRNNIQLEKAKEMFKDFGSRLNSLISYGNIVRPGYMDYYCEKVFEERTDEIKKILYDEVIRKTKDSDDTVLKTIKHYSPFIINNKSKIHFLLHDTYATLMYLIPKNQIEVDANDTPAMMIYPISNTLCFCMLYSDKEIDITKEKFEMPLEICNDEELIKQCFIDTYITKTAKSYVVDETNIDFVR